MLAEFRDALHQNIGPEGIKVMSLRAELEKFIPLKSFEVFVK